MPQSPTLRREQRSPTLEEAQQSLTLAVSLSPTLEGAQRSPTLEGVSPTIDLPIGPETLLKEWPGLLAVAYKLGYWPGQEQATRHNEALYSLKQSPRNWQAVLSTLLQSLGYSPLDSDPAIFYSPTHRSFIATYVDDCLIWSRQ